MGKVADYPKRSRPGELVWELATFYPRQGDWTKADYLEISDSRHGIEFVDGRLEFLPMPNRMHQDIVFLLCQLLKDYLLPGDGNAWVSGMRLQTQPRRIRVPDVVAVLDKATAGDELLSGADLVVEIVSKSAADRKRDYATKREEYAAAGIPEYWIVDPQQRRITVLALKDGAYVEHCVAGDGETAASALLSGFTVPVSSVFARS